MNWDAIIGIAEVIGVIAIVVSLMYVAAQIRQNSEIARATIVHDTSASFMNFHQMLASDGDLAGVYYRGTNSEELSEVEKVRFHAILEMYLALLEDVDHQYKTDLYFDEDGGVDIIGFIAPTYRPLLSSPVASLPAIPHQALLLWAVVNPRSLLHLQHPPLYC